MQGQHCLGSWQYSLRYVRPDMNMGHVGQD
jgi:hypothetical protein